nr:threonine ammonia-lyase, biosynthetic [uncultured Holophaga sp.]
MPTKYIKKILEAKVYEVAIETPLDPAPVLDERLGNHVFLKREDLQPVFSFKLRGAYNKIAMLSPEERKNGIVTASAGNHAQGVALAAQKLGIPAIIVMPKTTPQIKVSAVRRRKAKAVLFGDNYDDACAHALQLSEEQGLPFVHPFDDPDVIAGQGTIGMEILRQHPGPIDAIFIPVGGGGLIAGVAAYVKYLRPETKVIGVEPEGSAVLFHSLEAGKRVTLDKVDIFADGVAVKLMGEETFRIARKCVDEVIRVNTDEMSAAIKDIFDETRSIAEPSGALSVAGIKKYVEATGAKKQNLVGIISGANINFNRLRNIAERAELGEDRECIFALRLKEQPGALKAFCKVLGPRPITEFNYRYSDANQALVFIGLAVKDRDERESTLALLRGKGYQVKDLTGNELAKLHIRHMVGGSVRQDINEVVYRFEFPERMGALLEFLGHMADTWNISLFHYRNDGATYGQILLGVQVPSDERPAFRRFVEEVGYVWTDETENPAYQLFLGDPDCTVCD